LTVFRLWAPRARSVDIVIDSEAPFPMQPSSDDEWWTADVAGIRYRYRLDGGVPRPDPRSPSQPEGIDGPSQVVDHGAFGWTDQRWTGVPLASAVIYELHVGTFTPEATFDAVIDQLDHLIDLGVNAVELMPVAEFSGRRGWGYDGVLLYAPHHAYGGPDGLKRLIDACHGRGLAVIMDVVYNHLGPAGNYLAEYGPYFTDRYSTPWGQAVNFDGPGSDDVRRFFVDNALMWLRDYHCDGLRLDAVHAILDSSAVHVLEQLADEVSSLAGHLGRTVWLIAESNSNDPRLVRRRKSAGTVSTRSGATTSTTPYMSCSRARRPAITRTSEVAWPTSRPRCARSSCTTVGTLASGAAGTAVRSGRWPERGLSPIARHTTRSATAPSASASPPSRHRRGSGSPRPWCSPGRACRCCSRRGVGGVDAVPVLHRSRRSGAGSCRVGGSPQRVRRLRVETRRRPRPAGP